MLLQKFILIFTLLLSLKIIANPSPSFFYLSYEESKREFLAEIKRINKGEHIQIKIPSKIDSTLSTDIFYYKNPNSKKLLILTSGIHGTEAQVGTSAIIYYMKYYLEKHLAHNLSVLLIHSLNPYGHKYKRRVTENNIDLNRNLLHDTNIFNTQNPIYQKLSHILNPQEKINGLEVYKTFYQLTKELVMGATKKDLRQAIAGGQYQKANGISFGGHKHEPITIKLLSILPQILNQHQSIFHLDFHSGLGEKGKLHFITGSRLKKESKKMIKNIFNKKSSLYKLTLPSDKGFYHTDGDIINFITGMSKTDNVLSLAAEFGTMGIGLYSQVKTINSLIRDNQAYFFGYKNQSDKKIIKDNLSSIFFPNDNEWKNLVQLNIEHLYKTLIPNFLKNN